MNLHDIFIDSWGKNWKNYSEVTILDTAPWLLSFFVFVPQSIFPKSYSSREASSKTQRKKQYPARNHFLSHSCGNPDIYTPPKKRRFHVDSFYGFLIGSKLHLGEFCNVFSRLRPEFHDASSLNSFGPNHKGARNQWGRWSSNFL